MSLPAVDLATTYLGLPLAIRGAGLSAHHDLTPCAARRRRARPRHALAFEGTEPYSWGWPIVCMPRDAHAEARPTFRIRRLRLGPIAKSRLQDQTLSHPVIARERHDGGSGLKYSQMIQQRAPMRCS